MLKKLKPTTPSQRHTFLLKNDLKKLKPKNLIKGFQRSFGRNNQGKKTIKSRGGGHKRLYRLISFKRENVRGIIKHIEYDPNRSANILLLNNNNNFVYILAPENIQTTFIDSGSSVEIQNGNALPLKNIPIGSLIHNISQQPNKKGQYVRSAGTFGQLIQKTTNSVKVRLKSGEQKKFPLNCYATLGMVSNQNHQNIKKGKAGRNRWLNLRPKVRGVAKNPVDHPHGGGEGKTSGGRPSVTPKGWITKGKPTRKKKKIKINYGKK